MHAKRPVPNVQRPAPGAPRLRCGEGAAPGAYIRVELSSLPEIQSRYWSGMLDAAGAIQPPFGIVARAKRDEPAPVDDACAGLVTDVYAREEAERLRRLPYPVVVISNWIAPVPGLIHLLGDDEAVGRLAARHLLERGYRSFVGIGLEAVRFSEERLKGFSETVRAAGAGEVRRILLPRFYRADGLSPLRQIELLRPVFEPHLARMAPDAGCFAVTDIQGYLLLDLLRLRFPERVHTTGIIGVDNQEPRRWLPGDWPALTSVQPGCYALGQAVIRHLAGLAAAASRASAPRPPPRIPPEGVVVRGSTGGYACAHPAAGRAGRWIWERVKDGRPPALAEVARLLCLSARGAQRLFAAHHRCGVRAFILRIQIDRACQLLRTTDLQIGEVSSACGFAGQSAFARLFKQRLGQTPRAWRLLERWETG